MTRKQKWMISLVILTVFIIGYVLGDIFPVLAHDTDVQVEVNGKIISFPDQKPYIDRISGRTYVPIRGTGEALGCKITWDQDTKTVVVYKPASSDMLELQIGSKIPRMNGTAMASELDAPARLEGIPGGNWRTMVPLRFISESMGLNVLWDGGNRLVRISDKPFIATKELTAEQKARLMAYPYPADQNGKTYEIKDTDKMSKYGQGKCAYAPTTLDWYLGAIEQKAILHQGQRFITDADLCYFISAHGSNRIRGILQTYNSDGSVTEQDIEYGFDYGTEFGNGILNSQSHWLDGQVMVQLSKPKRVQ